MEWIPCKIPSMGWNKIWLDDGRAKPEDTRVKNWVKPSRGQGGVNTWTSKIAIPLTREQ